MQRHQLNDLARLGATFESICRMREQLILAHRNLVYVQFELIAQLCYRLVLTLNYQSHLGFENWRMPAPSTTR